MVLFRLKKKKTFYTFIKFFLVMEQSGNNIFFCILTFKKQAAV